MTPGFSPISDGSPMRSSPRSNRFNSAQSSPRREYFAIDTLAVPRRHARNGSSPFGSPNLHTMASTPLSFAESGLEALSVNEATAVNLYPHHNKSIHIVEHPAFLDWANPQPAVSPQALRIEPPSSYKDQLDTRFPDSAIEQPTITIDNSLIKQTLIEPPIVAIIPATPAEELEFELHDHKSILNKSQPVTPSPPSSRSTSLLQRARQYSDNIFHDTMRSLPLNRRSLNRRSIHVAQDNSKSVDGHLHPLWEPRGFWDAIPDEFSDVERSSRDSPDPEHDLLPPGGDTRDVTTPVSADEEQSCTPGPSRFGSLRGFLVGNTLGLERGPTNRRRHMVRWPTGKRRRRTASESAADEDAMPMLGMQVPSTSEFPRTNPKKMERDEGRNMGMKRMASVRESARRSAGAAQRERRKMRLRVGLRRPRWLFGAWRERLTLRKLAW